MSYSFFSVIFRSLPIVLIFLFNTAAAQEEYKPGFKGKKNMREFSVKKEKGDKTYKIKAEVVDDVVVMEGDMVIGTSSEFAGTQAVAIDGYKWPEATIPYANFSTHPAAANIQRAIDLINLNSSLFLRLVPRTNQTNYVEFKNVVGDGCWSYIGMRGGAQTIQLDGCSTGSIVHEILHAAGFFHEQSREDRDNFITINWNNIQSGKEDNFYRHNSIATDIATYDYGSIMHYPKTAFSKNGSNTIDIKIPPGFSYTIIGQRDGLSRGDISAINTRYPVPFGALAVGSSRTFDVFASNTHNIPSVYLRVGETYEFTTTGTGWNNGSTETNCNGYAPSIFDVARRYGDINMMTLTGEIFEQNNKNNFTGTYFKIGCSRTYTATKSGYLVTFANDMLPAYGDNSGRVTVTIRRTR